ncbi:WSC domain [Exophiala dermatitidis]|uniref:Protein SLG1 n=1 Tax=Exophiala dermatitidis TaxID=5970 RepID=A0AAN6IRZ8_EXODE|nr:WSC domain [Exophiala dermatitidis]KAJ4509247.1 WSC domain [Exophiala dermatitidis]KAJ4509434.1 WSC domain [Exophiala dermatitidis]KAJ4530427.1 WSC domain [Exophiala dermatitidis]KAJ4545399.1 WSC domain [Exophiala dermatitidis]
MKPSLFCATAVASALAFLSTPILAQTTSATAAAAITTLGCYKDSDPLTQQGTYVYQSSGWCQQQCVKLGKPVMATTGGSTCYCGDELPALDQEVDSSKCNTDCQGWPEDKCGGIGYWQVYLSGLTADVKTAPNSTTIASSASSTPTQGSDGATPTQPSVVTKAGQTVVVTASTSADNEHHGSSGPNKVGIAVGVVVGVIALGAMVGGVIFFLKRRRNREIEEEHRRNAAVSSFVGGTQSDKSSATDQRLDPSIYSHRRPSIGSIADERDFSRRILQVRNPDRDSKASNLA